MNATNKFSKSEKLKSKKAIDLLFSKGKSVNTNIIHAIYLPKDEPNNILVNAGVSVPKKNIKLAVDRNLIKRRMREAYRINNGELKLHLEKLPLEINLMFVYTAKQILTYKEIEDKIKVILTRLIDMCEVVNK